MESSLTDKKYLNSKGNQKDYTNNLKNQNKKNLYDIVGCENLSSSMDKNNIFGENKII